ncbi:hypothetical protein CMI37_28475 [Candidatus Pacearchaeota archaeon]|nr:hypothetical protein [Candidatus Pacearchaeota archaeon]
MEFHASSGEDYYDRVYPLGDKKDGELLEKIRQTIEIFSINEDSLKDPQVREALATIITEEVEEYYSDIS